MSYQKKNGQQASERYGNLSEEEKNKRHQYGCEQYRNLLEDEKQRLVQYRKTCSKMQKIKLVDSFINDNRLLHKMKK